MKPNFLINSSVLFLTALIFNLGYTQDKKIVLVNNGKSEYSIYVSDNAPESVKFASKEMQLYVKKTSGVLLPISVKFSDNYCISLGVNKHLEDYHLNSDGIIDEGFKIVTKGNNIFIWGNDTLDGKTTSAGGFSTGTLFGAYTFLEKYIGIRWLMPGEDGEYVPQQKIIEMPQINITDAPFFARRSLQYIQNENPEVKKWYKRNRLGESLQLGHGHNWFRIITPDEFNKHPDYFAEVQGTRIKPQRNDHTYKLCTANEEVIRVTAEAAIDYFSKNPQRKAFSLSPNDCEEFCECKKCMALDEILPDGTHLITRRILRFYNDVAERVAEKFPDKYLAGYVYAHYQEPPLDNKIKMHSNVFLVWASSMNYGCRHFVPEIRKKWHRDLSVWSNISKNLGYYDLPCKILQNYGAPNPPCRNILKSMFPALKKYGIKSVYFYGIEAWGYGGAYNYMLAKLAWSPDMDIDNAVDEYYMKCYGEGWKNIKKLFDLLELEIENYYISHPSGGYNMTPGLLRDVYAKNFGEIENCYKQALSEVKDEKAKKRLEMLGMNMKILCYSLNNFGLLKDADKSIFFLSQEDFKKFTSENKNSLAFAPIAKETQNTHLKLLSSALTITPYNQKIANSEQVKPYCARSPQHIIIYVETDQNVKIGFDRTRPISGFSNCKVYNSMGKELCSANVTAENSVSFFAPTGYYHVLVEGGTALSLRIPENLSYAIDSTMGKGIRLLGLITPLYFYVPENTSEFIVSISSCTPGETALAKLYDPDNKLVCTLRTVESPSDTQSIKNDTNKTGFWKLVPSKAEKGVLDDVWVRLDPKLSGYLSVNPEKLLVIKKSQYLSNIKRTFE